MCVEPEALVRKVTMWLHGSNIDPSVRVDVSAAPQEKEVQFVVRRGGTFVGKKTMRADELTCSEFEAAVALAIASALEAVIMPATPVEPATPRLEPEPTRPPAFVARTTPRTAFRPRIAVGAELAVAAGYLMAPSALLSPNVELSFAERFDLRLSFALSADQTRALGPGLVTMQTVFGSLSVCYVVLPSSSHVRLRACAGASVGGTAAEARGFVRNSGAVAPWGGLDAGLDVRWPADAALAMVVGLRGDVIAVPPTFEVETVGAVRTNPVAGGGFIGLQAIWPR